MPELRDVNGRVGAWPLFVVVLLAAAMLQGCAANQAKPADYNAQFASGRYSEAYESSSKVASSLHSIHRDQAALIAGLSARAMDRSADAKKWLEPLASNADAGIAGKACVALGSIAHDEGRHLSAADLFTRAGTRLPGDDAAHALMCAGDSWRALGKREQAMTCYRQAQEKLVSDQQLRVEIGDRLAGVNPPMAGNPKTAAPTGRFTVQTGAFSTLKKAQTEARRYIKHGSSHAVPIKTPSGKTLYAVQVGRYQSKTEADRVRRTLGHGAIVAEVVD